MEPEKFGRTLGIGVRVASNLARDRAARARNNQTQQPAAADPRSEPAAAPARQVAAKTQALGHGAKKFGEAFLGPFRHAGSVLWLEITGVFFIFFTVYFAQSVYRVHGAWRHGAEHAHFVLFAALTLLFAWFALSSFLRARKKERKVR